MILKFDKSYKILILVSGIISLTMQNLLGNSPSAPPSMNYSIKVMDSSDSSAILSAKVILKRDNVAISYSYTNMNGLVNIPNLSSGKYYLQVGYFEFETFKDTILIDLEHNRKDIWLIPNHKEAWTKEITVSSQKATDIQTIDLNTGAQLFESQNYHASPDSRITDLIQQNLLGAVKAPSGEVHIRGMHGEYSYYIDGAPIPLGVFGGLNEIIDSKVIQRMTLMTGGFPAEYGGQLAAVLDIQTVIPVTHFHLDI